VACDQAARKAKTRRIEGPACAAARPRLTAATKPGSKTDKGRVTALATAKARNIARRPRRLATARSKVDKTKAVRSVTIPARATARLRPRAVLAREVRKADKMVKTLVPAAVRRPRRVTVNAPDSKVARTRAARTVRTPAHAVVRRLRRAMATKVANSSVLAAKVQVAHGRRLSSRLQNSTQDVRGLRARGSALPCRGGGIPCIFNHPKPIRAMNTRLLILAVSVTVAGLANAADWPRFRGSNGTGIAANAKPPTVWSDTRNLNWKTTLPGAGASSPIAWGERVFVTCYSGDVPRLQRHLVCVNRRDGRILWAKSVPAAQGEDEMGGRIGEHGYASHTPATDGERVYVFFGKSGVFAFDFNGAQLWQTSVGTGSNQKHWGSASSLMLYKNLVIVTASEESHSIRALDSKTGREVWKAEGSQLNNVFATPVLVEAEGRTDLVIAVPDELWGLNPDTGKLRWFAQTGLRGNITPGVVAADGIVVACGGFPQLGAVAFRAGGKGDVTKTHLLWSGDTSTYVPTPVLHQGRLYFVSDAGLATCLNATTGEVVFKERLPGVSSSGRGGKPFYASTVMANGCLYAVSRRQGTFVIAAKPKFEFVAQNTFAGDDSEWNATPAITGNHLLLRSNRFLYSVESGTVATQQPTPVEAARASIAPVLAPVAAGANVTRPYVVVGTGQTKCYDNQREIQPPRSGQPFYGQDAQRPGPKPVYTLSAGGLTVHDQNTGLTWQRNPDTDGNGQPTSKDKLTLAQAQTLPAKLNAARFSGYSDWRLPTIKELYSLILFSGVDGRPDGDSSQMRPFIDTRYFKFAYGDERAGERIIDSQWATSSVYIANPNQMFGVNFADGRIKGYPIGAMHGRPAKTYFVLCVRGNPAYGKNDFRDNGDGTVTDRATGLMWSKRDSGKGMNWEAALAWAQARNAERYLGYNDWRLPNAKELQSIVDCTRAPAVTQSPAIDPVFQTTKLSDGEYPFFWSNTTHQGGPDRQGGAAVYVAFGRATGWMQPPFGGRAGGPGGFGKGSPRGKGGPGFGGASENLRSDGSGNYQLLDVHGAGAQRSDPKAGDPTAFPHGRGPQGDVVRINNFVRLVRNAEDADTRTPQAGGGR
jgi:outer membrane protein assembly factor BamB